MEQLFWLVKNFVWILIGFLLVRTPLTQLAKAGSDLPSAEKRGPKLWRTVRIIAGLYCILVSFWNLLYSLVLHFRGR